MGYRVRANRYLFGSQRKTRGSLLQLQNLGETAAIVERAASFRIPSRGGVARLRAARHSSAGQLLVVLRRRIMFEVKRLIIAAATTVGVCAAVAAVALRAALVT